MVFWNLWLYTNFQLWSLRLHGDGLHKVRLLGQWSQSWFHCSGITQSTGWLLEACNPWRHQHQKREAFLHKKLIKGPLGCHGTFAEFENITSRERSESSQGSLWKSLYTVLTAWRQVHTAGAFPCQSYCALSLPQLGQWQGKNTEKGKKCSLCYYGNLSVIFRDKLFRDN